jgi:hypothetical protein
VWARTPCPSPPADRGSTGIPTRRLAKRLRPAILPVKRTQPRRAVDHVGAPNESATAGRQRQIGAPVCCQGSIRRRCDQTSDGSLEVESGLEDVESRTSCPDDDVTSAPDAPVGFCFLQWTSTVGTRSACRRTEGGIGLRPAVELDARHRWTDQGSSQRRARRRAAARHLAERAARIRRRDLRRGGSVDVPEPDHDRELVVVGAPGDDPSVTVEAEHVVPPNSTRWSRHRRTRKRPWRPRRRRELPWPTTRTSPSRRLAPGRPGREAHRSTRRHRPVQRRVSPTQTLPSSRGRRPAKLPPLAIAM